MLIKNVVRKPTDLFNLLVGHGHVGREIQDLVQRLSRVDLQKQLVIPPEEAPKLHELRITEQRYRLHSKTPA
jgi:hypothetical protein